MSATADTVKPSAATEHTTEPQLASDVRAHDTSSATEHADPASGWVIAEVQGADWQSVATEHDAPSVATERDVPRVATDHDDILLTIDAATKIRDGFKGQAGWVHNQARTVLNAITEKAGQDDTVSVYDIYDLIPWKEYISMHAQCQEIIGPGITAAYIEKIHNTRDPNRGNKERVDYVFYRANNTFCRVHPGYTNCYIWPS